MAAVGLVVGAAAPALAAGDSDSIRLAGQNRYETAGQLYSRIVVNRCGPGNLVVASGEDYHDALAGSFLAGQGGTGGVLLTQNSVLPPGTTQYLVRCSATATPGRRIVVVDGGAQISDEVVSDLRAGATYGASTTGLVTAERIHSDDAYSTAAAVARTPGATVGSTQAYGRTAFVVSGENFPDALAASPIVYSQHVPLLYTQKDSLPQVTADALAALDVQTVLLLGGPAAISHAVEAQLATRYRVVRVAGDDRQGTAAALADLAITTYGFSGTRVQLARGDDFPDALAAGQYAGGGSSLQPLLLTRSPADLGGTTRAHLQAHRTQLLGRVGVVGGTAAVSDAVYREAQRAAGS